MEHIIIARGMELATNELNRKTPGDRFYDRFTGQHGVVRWSIIIASVIGPAVLMALARYIIGNVVATLAMVEDTTSVPRDSKAESEKPLLLASDESQVQHEKPITTSLRASMRHLKNDRGIRGLLRGVHVSIVYSVLHSIAANLIVAALSTLLPHVISYSLGYIFASTLLARIHMIWTHCMISRESHPHWWRQRPRGRAYFKIVAPVSAMLAITQQIAFGLSYAVFWSFGPVEEAGKSDAEKNMILVRLLATLATALFCSVAIVLPASITLTRIEASLLSEETETIVKVDRTLGGVANDAVVDRVKIRPALYHAAWRSFKVPNRINILMLYVKYGATMVTLFAFWIAAIVAAVML